MEFLSQLQPEPTTLKAALAALRVAEARLTVAIQWITQYRRGGQIPPSLREKLRCAGLEEDVTESGSDPAAEKQSRKSTRVKSCRQPILEDSYLSEDGSDADNQMSPNSGYTDNSESEAEQADMKYEPINAVDFCTVTDEDSADFTPLDVKAEPGEEAPLHECTHCFATFESAPALSVHSLVHAELRLRKLVARKRSRKPNKKLVRELPILERKVKAKRPAVKCAPRKKTEPSTSSKKERKPRTKYRVKAKAQAKCYLCPQKLPSGNDLKKHLRLVHKVLNPCNICRVQFPNPRQLANHVREAHPEVNTYKCERCEVGYLTQARLNYHMTRVHPEPDKATTCEVCGKLCKSQTMLKDHLKRNHVDPSLAVTCPTCGVKVKTAELLKFHMERHVPRSFLCQTCGFNTKTQKELDNHIKAVHSTTRLHTCPHCPLTFKTAGVLKQHVNRHFMKNLKACQYCGIEKVPKDLSNHILIVHKGRKFKCAHCSAMFSLRAHLKNHYTLKHPSVKIPADDELEVIYTKTPEETSTPAPPSAKRPRVTQSVKAPGGLSCDICPGAVFHTRDDFELHILRHEKDPDYKVRHRVHVQVLNQAHTAQVTTPEPEQPQAPAEHTSQQPQTPVQFPPQASFSGSTPQYHGNPFLNPHLEYIGFGAFPPPAYTGGMMLPDSQLMSGHQEAPRF